ncbi:MAG1360 family OppF-related protein [Mycoplasmopsis lipofaciens]|uniref:MAG1360 family OppF-related protein n=1 Tax=Mycoplasmopsis lipofaciens TaxID=114884 RepID=UPI0004852B31|nr:hypothetical protein [Mycoplasmopsis lipofaciens]
MNKRKIFSFQKCFIKKNEEFVVIPKIDIYENVPAAIWVVDNSDTFFKNNFFNILSSEDAISTSFSYDKKSIIRDIYYNKWNKFNKMDFFNMSSDEQNDYKIPLIDKISELKKYYECPEEKLIELENTLKKYNFPIRMLIFSILNSNVFSIMEEYKKQKNEYDKYVKSLIKNLSTSDLNLAQNNIKKFKEIENLFFENTLKKLFDIFDFFFSKMRLYYQQSKNNIEFLCEEKIKYLKEEINVFKKIKHNSRDAILNQFKIRDLKQSNIVLHQILKEINYNSKESLDYLIHFYNKSSEISAKKMTYVEKNSLQYQYIAKQMLLENYVVKFLTRNKKFLSFLDIEFIDEIKTNLDFQIKLFINNNLSSSNILQKNFSIQKVKRIIQNEFYFKLENYKAHSRAKYDQIIDLINQNKEKIEFLKHKKNSYSTLSEYDSFINSLNIKLSNAESEQKWKLNRLKEKYYKNIKNNKLEKIFSSINEIIKYINKNNRKISSFKFLWKNFKGNKTLENKNKILNLADTLHKNSDHFSSLNFMFNYLDYLKNALFSNNLNIKKVIQDFDILFNLIDILGKVSISLNSLIKPFVNITHINKLKINFMSLISRRPKLIVIVDDLELKNKKIKNEFLKIAYDICDSKNITLFFVSSDLELIVKNNFKYMYACNKNGLLEYGLTSAILKKPINSLVQNYMNKSSFSNSQETQDLFFSELFDVENNHFIFATSNYIKNKSVNKNNLSSLIDISNQEKTLEKQIDDLVNPFDKSVAIIADFKIGKNKLPKTSKNLLKKYNEYFKENNNINLDLPSIDDLY